MINASFKGHIEMPNLEYYFYEKYFSIKLLVYVLPNLYTIVFRPL